MPRRTNKDRVREYVVAAALTLAVIWLLSLVFGIVRKEEIARKTVAETRAELSALKEREATLEDDLTELSTDRGQEASLRQTFGVAKPGEEVIIVVPEEELPPPPPVPWWQRVLHFLGV